MSGARWGRRTRGLAAAAVVILLVCAAGASPAIALLAALTIVVMVSLFLVPKQALVGMGLFLLVQPLLVNLAGGIENPLGLTLHRLHEAFAVAAVLRIAFFLSWDGLEPKVRHWVWLTVLFLATGLGSGFVAHVPLETLALGAFLAVKFEVFLFLALTIPWSERDCARIMRAALWLGPIFFVGGVVISLLPLGTQRLFMEGHDYDFVRGDFNAMHGIFSHPGVFGWVMAVTGCYAVAALLVGRSTWRPAATASLASSVLGILGSLRRKPLVALPIVAVYGVTRFARGRRRWWVLALFTVLGAGGAWLVTDRLEAIYANTLEYVDPSGPTAPRILLYVTGVEIADAHFPLGAGFGRFGGYVSVLDYSPLYDEYGLSRVSGLTRNNPEWIADAYWPHIAAEAGWFGALVLGVLYLLLMQAAARAAFRAQDPATKAVAVAAGLALLEAIGESVAGPVFEITLFTFVLAIPLGITLVRATAPLAAPVSALTDQKDVSLPSSGEPLE